MAEVRIATFNCENLFARFRFKEGIDPEAARIDGWDVNDTAFQPLDPISRGLTAQAIKATDADVVALQEVENLDTLRHFRSEFLGGYSAYPYVVCLDGNDPRLIDVAVLSRLPLVHLRSYQYLREGSSYVFSRDCLEVDVDVGGEVPLTLFVNHLKSMMGGRAATRARREVQAEAVKEVVEARFGSAAGEAPFVVLGDLNDFPQSDEQGESGIGALLEWDEVENVVERLSEEERWTHFWDSGNQYRQLDYLLVSSSLAEASDDAPQIVRQGMPLRATRYTGERFEGVDEGGRKASDHCPVAMGLEV